MFAVIPPTHFLRPTVEETIRSAFLREHGARLETLPHWLVADIDRAGAITCAASLRFADDGFFAERYLDEPIERLIARQAGLEANRADVAELGSLASAHSGALTGPFRSHFMLDIIRLLRDRGMQWAIFTATARLRTLLRQAGVPLIELAVADPARSGNEDAWGGYYRHDPRVMLVGDHMLGPTLRPAEDRGRRHA
jgi:hypothetical protein